MLRFKWGIVLAICLSVTATCFAQSSSNQPEKSKDEKKSKTRSVSPREQARFRFAAGSPKVGQLLPDVSAYDADGKPFKLSSLKGQYTVMVFGCLT